MIERRGIGFGRRDSFVESPVIFSTVTFWITGDLAVKAGRPFRLGSGLDFLQDLWTGHAFNRWLSATISEDALSWLSGR
jgi:hypothetical protein